MNLERLEAVLANIEDMVEPEKNIFVRADDNSLSVISGVQFLFGEKVLFTANLDSSEFSYFKAVIDSFINVIGANKFLRIFPNFNKDISEILVKVTFLVEVIFDSKTEINSQNIHDISFITEFNEKESNECIIINN